MLRIGAFIMGPTKQAAVPHPVLRDAMGHSPPLSFGRRRGFVAPDPSG